MMLERDDLDKAFNKELFIIRNDLYYQQLEFNKRGAKSILRVDIVYKPQQALSGDSYSLRKTKDGRIVGFIVDAMGKGISAALTSMGATRFLNYYFDELEEEGSFDFELWTKKFVKFMAQNLMEEEMLSIALMELNLKQATTSYALCGMPAFLMQMDNDERTFIKSNNPPMMRHTQSLKITSVPIGHIQKMLCYTDGLSESMTRKELMYNAQMRQDFFKSACVKEFNTYVSEAIDKGDDDITYIYIQKRDLQNDRQHVCIESSYSAMDEVLQTIALYLKEQHIHHKCASEIILALSELLLNALEHGNFGISLEAKNELIAKDSFDVTMKCLEAIHKDKSIDIAYTIISKNQGKMFEATISDSGAGFDVQKLKSLVVDAANFNGRGFVIIKKLVDHFYFNVKGNAITIQKFLTLDSELQ